MIIIVEKKGPHDISSALLFIKKKNWIFYPEQRFYIRKDSINSLLLLFLFLVNQWLPVIVRCLLVITRFNYTQFLVRTTAITLEEKKDFYSESEKIIIFSYKTGFGKYLFFSFPYENYNDDDFISQINKKREKRKE